MTGRKGIKVGRAKAIECGVPANEAPEHVRRAEAATRVERAVPDGLPRGPLRVA